MSIKYPTQGELDWQSLISSALTAEITINPLPFQVAMKRAVAHYNQHNSNHIRAGLKQTMEVGTPRALNATALWIRHNQTNYDQIWPRFAVGDDQNAQPWQIIFRRTMRLIEQTYPELITQVHSAVTHRLPLDIREAICFPCPLEDIVREVRERGAKLGVDYEPSLVRWRELLRQHILMSRTDYRLLVKNYEGLPEAEKAARTAEARSEAMYLINIAFPELKGDIRPYVREATKAEAVTASEAGADSPEDAAPLSETQEAVAPTAVTSPAPPVPASYDSGFRLEAIPLDRLLAQTIWAYNSTIQSPSQTVLSIDGDEGMQAEIRLRSIAHLLNTHSSRGLLIGSLSSMPGGEAKRFMVRAVELAAHQAICRAYPELAKESEIELNRRLSGAKFGVPKDQPASDPEPVVTSSLVVSTPEPCDKATGLAASLIFRPITLDKLLKSTVDYFNDNQPHAHRRLHLNGSASMQKKIRSLAVTSLVNTRSNYPGLCAKVQYLSQDVSEELLRLDQEVHDRVASMFPELAIESSVAMHRRIANRRMKSIQKAA